MGYYITLTSANFVIPAELVEKAAEAMIALNTTHDHLKRGGSFFGGETKAKWFSWMPEDYSDLNAEGIFKHLGFEVEVDDDGDLSLISYDSKMGQEELFIEAAGKFALPGWSLNWEGEDDSTWTVSDPRK